MQGEKNVLVPEDIGRQAAYMLLEEVQRGGVCDSMHQVHDLSAIRPAETLQQSCSSLTQGEVLMDHTPIKGEGHNGCLSAGISS